MPGTIVAPASWTACAPSALGAAAPRFRVPPRAAYTRGPRLLKLEFPDHTLVAKRMPDEAAARTLVALTGDLARGCEHVPAPTLAPSADARDWWICTPFLEGIAWLHQGGPQLLAAAALASLHATMRALPAAPIRAAAAARHARTFDWLERHSGAQELRALAACAGMDVRGLRRACEAWLASPSQPVHHDLHPSNLWWAQGRLWFLDFEELPSAYLPVSADLARYLERHLLQPAAAERALDEFWLGYRERSGTRMPASAELFAALAWNWLDSWAVLQGFTRRPPDFESERAKFLELLQLHASAWPRLAARLDALNAA
jgi:hypothetical protein